MTRVLVLGGGGTMAKSAIASAAGCSSIETIVVADRDAGAAQAAAALHPGRAEPLTLDIRDSAAVYAAAQGATAIVNCAGPYHKLGLAPLEAAIANGLVYLDFCDDWETMQAMRARDGAAKASGCLALTGMGASPGLTNLLARVARDALDTTSAVTLGWRLDSASVSPVAAERQSQRGAHAAAQHFLHQTTGRIGVLRDGTLVKEAALSGIALTPPGLAASKGYTIGHTEAVTLPSALPDLRRAETVVLMAAREAVVTAGLTARIEAGTLDTAVAAEMLLGTAALPFGLAWRARVAAWGSLLARRPDYPPLFAWARGSKNGTPHQACAWLTRLPKGIAAASGVPLAVALKLAVTHRIEVRGVVAPEEALDPYLFFEEFARRTEVLGQGKEPLIHVEHGSLEA
jgi:saccharopine dehydrogenase-like NADP-dependent oxidoreductase